MSKLPESYREQDGCYNCGHGFTWHRADMFHDLADAYYCFHPLPAPRCKRDFKAITQTYFDQHQELLGSRVEPWATCPHWTTRKEDDDGR